jgi:integrase
MAAHLGASIPHARNVPTFGDAAASYLEHGGEARYLPPIVAWFGDTPVAAITPFDVKQMASALYDKARNTTKNRQALTPTRAVLMHAYERGWCPLLRLTRFRPEPRRRKSPASPAWLQLFVRQCDKEALQHLAALVLFMSLTGARVSEAVRLHWPEVDLGARKAVLLRTKTSTNSVRELPDELVRRLRMLQDDADLDAPVFRYTSRYSINDRIKAVCARAELPYKSSHTCGRHSFATNAIAFGISIKDAMDAGDWRSSSVFLETYVHPRNASRLVADRFNAIDFELG